MCSWVAIKNLSYRPDIDGLRAIAVLPVVLYHAGIELFSGGFVGVDVFFVISGYLITTLLLSEIESEKFRFKDFYARRARRLFPALFSVLGFSAILGLFLLMPQELENLGESLASTALFGSNILFFSENGYFTGPAESKPLLHTWSLAIEEQYYLLFPGFLLFISRFARSRYFTLTASIFCCSLTYSIWSVEKAPDAAFYLLQSRAWELLLGSLLAMTHVRPQSALIRECGCFSGIVMILISVFSYSAATEFPGLLALLPCVGTSLVIMCGVGEKQTLVTRFLSLRIIVFVGLISYSLYLWHWPILVFAQHYLLRPLEPAETTALVVLSIVVAVASWRFIEQPFRGPNRMLSTGSLFRFSAAMILCVVTIGITFDQTEGLPQRMPTHVLDIAKFANDRPIRRKQCEGIAPRELTYHRACRLNEVAAKPSVAVWGDSHAMAVMATFGQSLASFGRNGLNFTSNGCAPVLDVSRQIGDLSETCPAFARKTLSILSEHKEIDTIILVSRWARHAEGTPYGIENQGPLFLANGDKIARTVTENRIIFRNALMKTLDELASLNRRIIILGSIPEMGVDVPNVLAKARWRGVETNLAIERTAFSKRQAFVVETFRLAEKKFTVEIYDASSYFCTEASCVDVSISGEPLYADNNHVSSFGAARLTPLFHQILSGAPARF